MKYCLKKFLNFTWLVIFFLEGCAGQPSDDKIKIWTNNERGLEELKKFVADTKNPVERRVFALQVLSNAGLNSMIRTVLDKCTDHETVAHEFSTTLIEQLKSDNPQKALVARDNLFIVLSYVPAQQQDHIKTTIADWAFGDIKDDDPADKVKSVIESKILISQIEELGKYGVRGAALLIKHGFKIEKLSDFILSLDDINIKLKLLDAIKALHSMPLPEGKRVAVEYLHIDKIAEIKHPSTAAYLLDIAADNYFSKDIRSWAFNKADALLESKEIKDNPAEVIPKLYKFLQSKNPDDRWDSALFLLKLEGTKAISGVVNAFQDDGIYATASEDPIKSAIDFCKDGLMPLKNKAAITNTLDDLLKSNNRIQNAIGIICYKVNGDKNVIPLLKPFLSKKKVMLNDFLGEENISLASLAQNATDGILINQEIEEEIKTGKLSKENGDLKKFVFLVELVKIGNEYRDSALKRFEEELKENAKK